METVLLIYKDPEAIYEVARNHPRGDEIRELIREEFGEYLTIELDLDLDEYRIVRSELRE